MSRLRKFKKEELRDIINKSFFVKDVLLAAGLPSRGASYKTLEKIIIEYELFDEFNNLKKRREERIKNSCGIHNKINSEEIFCINSKIKGNTVKRRLIKDEIMEYKCSKCGNEGEWIGEKLVLQLEHKNGDNTDNRIENLEFLCPNCHTQTKTWGLKKRNEKDSKSLLRKKDFEELAKLRLEKIKDINLMEFGWVDKVSKIWGIKHTAVKKWIRKYYPDLKYYERKNMVGMM